MGEHLIGDVGPTPGSAMRVAIVCRRWCHRHADTPLTASTASFALLKPENAVLPGVVRTYLLPATRVAPCRIVRRITRAGSLR